MGLLLDGAPVFLAQVSGDPLDWVNFGVAGLVIFSLIMGWFVPGRTHDREVARGDRLETELRERNAYIEDKVVPALTRAVDVLERRASSDPS